MTIFGKKKEKKLHIKIEYKLTIFTFIGDDIKRVLFSFINRLK